MRQAPLLLAVMLALAACGQKPREPAGPIDSEQLNAIASSGPTIAETLAAGNDATPATPAPVAFTYEGNWAGSAAMCAGRRWRFGARSVTRAGGESCAVLKSEARTDSEIKLTLQCAIGPVRTSESWSLVRRGDGSMIVARTAGNKVPESTTLRRCAT